MNTSPQHYISLSLLSYIGERGNDFDAQTLKDTPNTTSKGGAEVFGDTKRGCGKVFNTSVSTYIIALNAVFRKHFA